jgi:ABC-type glycerol-3-phosphate transport system substrate-binding protein
MTFTKSPFSYEFCVLPVTDQGTTAVVDIWNAFSIAKNSDQVELAKEFIRFLFSADELNQMAEIKGLPTVVAAGNGDARYASLSKLPPESIGLCQRIKVCRCRYEDLQRFCREDLYWQVHS